MKYDLIFSSMFFILLYYYCDFPLLHQLRESLEESISQLQSQRLSRSNGARSASASTSPLHPSDLELHSGSGVERRQLLPSVCSLGFAVVTCAILSGCFRWSTFLCHLSAERRHRHKPSEEEDEQEEEVSLCLCSFRGCQSHRGGRKGFKVRLWITATCLCRVFSAGGKWSHQLSSIQSSSLLKKPALTG